MWIYWIIYTPFFIELSFENFLAPCISTLQSVTINNRTREHMQCVSSVDSDRPCLSLNSSSWRSETSCFTEPKSSPHHQPIHHCRMRYLDNNTFWSQLSLNWTCSSTLCELMNVDSVGLTAPRVPGVSIQLCVCQRLAEDKATSLTVMSDGWRCLNLYISRKG